MYHRYHNKFALSGRDDASGFTLLEVIISVSILLTMTVAITALMRASVDMRFSLAEQAVVTHRVSSAMTKLTQDIQHVFIISTKDNIRNPGTRKNNGIFKVETTSTGDTLYLTTMSHEPMLANSNESSATYVIYRLQDDKDIIGRRHLYRGEAKVIPEDLKDEPPMQLFASNIKSIRIRAWKGDDWSKEGWDTTRSDWRNILPKVVQIEIEAAEVSGDGPARNDGKTEDPTVIYRTEVYIPAAFGMPELKPQSASLKWVWPT